MRHTRWRRTRRRAQTSFRADTIQLGSAYPSGNPRISIFDLIGQSSVFGTFPLMAGHWVPADLFALDPWFVNFFENVTTVQFDHRLIAWLLALSIPLFWLRTRRMRLPGRARLPCGLLLGVLIVQISLGISTLVLGVPVVLAAAHQAGALLLFTAALLTHHEVRNF